MDAGINAGAMQKKGAMFFHGGKASLASLSEYPSRYPFPYFFGTTNRKLAEDYAWHHSRNRLNVTPFHLALETIVHTIPWNKDTYTKDFRDLILSLHHQGHKAVLITGCLDRPSRGYITHRVDILAIFDYCVID